jgi:hypothetical protein
MKRGSSTAGSSTTACSGEHHLRLGAQRFIEPRCGGCARPRAEPRPIGPDAANAHRRARALQLDVHRLADCEVVDVCALRIELDAREMRAGDRAATELPRPFEDAPHDVSLRRRGWARSHNRPTFE